MKETAGELASLQRMLDASLAGATEHLRAIVTPGRTLDARELCDLLTGMRTLAVSTVTATGEPRVSGVDGHFWHGRWVFTTSGTAAKARHLRARPAVSAAHLVGDDLGVFCHGRAQFLTAEDPEWAPIEAHLTAHYGSSPTTWDPDIVYVRIAPHWRGGYAGDKAALRATVRGATYGDPGAAADAADGEGAGTGPA
jgi:hypothetical protein